MSECLQQPLLRKGKRRGDRQGRSKVGDAAVSTLERLIPTLGLLALEAFQGNLIIRCKRCIVRHVWSWILAVRIRATILAGYSESREHVPVTCL